VECYPSYGQLVISADPSFGKECGFVATLHATSSYVYPAQQKIHNILAVQTHSSLQQEHRFGLARIECAFPLIDYWFSNACQSLFLLKIASLTCMGAYLSVHCAHFSFMKYKVF
jgi:hypothetical protein